jgi:hypothetical protein
MRRDAKIRLMPKRGPRYRIDPIEPTQVSPRFTALVARLEPVLDAADVEALRALLDAGDHASAYARLDAITDDPSRTFETADLIELVLLGQAIRPA